MDPQTDPYIRPRLIMPIPAEFLDLAECPRVAALTTVMPDGSPQTSVVWCDTDGEHLRINCMRHFRKTRNMAANPRVTLLCFDPREPLRFLEVRGTVVEMTEEGALEHLDGLVAKYLGRPARYFGDCIPERFAEAETPVLIRIRPTRVIGLDARCGGEHDCASIDAEGPPAVAAGRSIPPPSECQTPEAATIPPAPDPAPADVELPTSHRDLFGPPDHGVLTTLMPDGQPQSSLVWLDLDGGCVRVNTTRERQKGRNMERDPRVSLLVVDAADTGRYIQVRGVADVTAEGALEHLDELTRRYTRHPCYYGHIHPDTQRDLETRIVCRIHPRRITLDAIHA